MPRERFASRSGFAGLVRGRSRAWWVYLSETLYGQPKYFILNLSFEHAPHKIPFQRPQVQQAFVTLPGNGILGLCEIEDHRTVFNDDGIARAHEKVFDRAHKRFRGHRSSLSDHSLLSL
jgi:hypothetical protein